MKTRPAPHTIGIISLGCAKNLVDTEVLMRQLDASSFRLILEPDGNEPVDTVIINTCGFILDAKNESLDSILHYVQAKAEGRIRFLFVMGCLSERYREQLREEIPEVDDFFGVHELGKIIERVGGKFRKELLGERRLLTPSHYAYLKIAEGCDRHCSFCSIPMIRGSYVSRPVNEILEEAKLLVAGGVKEINVIAQDTTYYGLDLYKKRVLPELIGQLAGIRGLEWIRLHYTYPEGFPLGVMEVMKRNKNICRYIDIPLQHINSGLLKSMKRVMDKEQTIELIARFRSEIPHVAVRSTLMVGYPGETQKNFEELMEFVSFCRFDRLGVFTYSHEEGTAAFSLKDNVPARIKQERASQLMEIQQEISLELNTKKIGTTLKVLIDREEEGFYIGRSEFDSPGIDHEVLIPSTGRNIQIGTFVQAMITSADPFDLYGKIPE